MQSAGDDGGGRRQRQHDGDVVGARHRQIAKIAEREHGALVDDGGRGGGRRPSERHSERLLHPAEHVVLTVGQVVEWRQCQRVQLPSRHGDHHVCGHQRQRSGGGIGGFHLHTRTRSVIPMFLFHCE